MKSLLPVRITIIAILFFLCYNLYSQNVTISAAPGGLAGATQIGGTSDIAVFGVQLAKAAGGGNTVTSISFSMSSDPNGKFTNARLYESSDGTFSGVGSETLITSGTINTTNIVFNGAPLTSFGGGAGSKYFFVVVDVDPNVTGATAAIQPSLLSTGVVVSASTVGGATIMGTSYSFTALTTTITQLTGGVSPSPLGSGDTDQALLGFSISSNGTPDFTDIIIPVSSPIGKISNIRLFSSIDNTFDGSDASIGATATVTATEIQLTGFTEPLSSTQNYFVVVDINTTVNSSTPQLQPSFTEANVTVSAGAINVVTVTGTDYSFADTSPPIPTITTDGNSPAVSVIGNITITFDEPIRKLDDSAITSGDLNTLVELKLTDNSGAAVTFTATIDATNKIITINPTSNLLGDETYYVEMNSVEDVADNASSSVLNNKITFTTELPPAFASFAGPTCVGESITLNSLSNTGGSVAVPPSVSINGVSATVTNYIVNSSITFLIPNTTNGAITIANNDNTLSTTSGVATVIRQAIDTTLTVTPSTLNPTQNTSVDVMISNTQSSGYTYSLILNSGPSGYTATTQNINGNNGDQTLTTTPALSAIGDYFYRIDVSRSGCTTKKLANTPIKLSVASLAVVASATDVTVCLGSSTTLIGSTSGGTGFYQFSWTSDPSGFTSSNSSPTVTPTVNTRYTLTLTDNSSNTATDFVDVIVNPVPTPSIDPAPTETVVRTNYTIENNYYRLYGTPSGGAFSGQGVTLNSDGFYYFNPQNAGVGDWTITYALTNAFGCNGQVTEIFKVNNIGVNGLELSYCKNRIQDSPLSYNVPNFPAGYQFTRLIFYSYDYSTSVNCIAETAPTFNFCGNVNPLTVNSYQLVPDIQAGVSLPPGTLFSQPVSYTLNIDEIRNNYGYSTDHSFYILVYGKDNQGNETYRTYQFFNVLDNGPVPTIVGINEDENVCSNATPITLSSSEPGYSITNFSTVPAAQAAALSGANNKIFNPGHTTFSGQDERSLIITMGYSDFNNCPNTTERNFNWIKKPNAPLAPDVSYCKITSGGAKPFTINAKPNGPGTNPYWYAQNPVSNPTTAILDSINFQGFIAPGITGLLATSKDFFVTQSYKGCEGDFNIVNIEIKDAPNANFITPPICEDRDFTLSGPLDNGVPYSQYNWSYGDGQDTLLLDNNSVTYNYGPDAASSKPFIIELIVTNNVGCKNSSKNNASVNLNPKPEFSFNSVCENDTTKFYATTNIPVSSYEWDFGDASPTIGPGTFKNVKHKFANGAGDYKVKVTTYTAQGCFNSDSTLITILNYLTYTSVLPYDMVGIEGGKGYWTIEDFKDSSTWEFNIPNKSIIKSALPVWITAATGNYKANDASVVNSPCLNISGIEKPVLELSYMSNTQERQDGATLEYSIDNGINWKSVGAFNSGSNWFNTAFFFTGKIGNSVSGWSGDNFTLDQTNTASWVQGKRSIDNIVDLIPVANRNKVRFRVAFKSDGQAEFEGFAFNNFSIKKRNRTVLVENFTNRSSSKYVANNTNFNAISDLETAKLQYHLAYPDDDVNSTINRVDPAARAAYYGISLSDQLIPRGVIDGYSDGNFITTDWVNNTLDDQSLITSPFDTLIIKTKPADPSFNIVVSAISNTNITTGKPIMHVVVVEKTVDTDNYVVRKMLPDATGTPLTLPIIAGVETAPIELSWFVNSSDIDITDLAIVAFVQDELTGKVLQATVLKNPIDLPTLVTGIEPTFAEQINIYPNPADQSVTIELPKSAKEKTSLKMFDVNGHELHNKTFETGERSKVLSTSNFSTGIYFIQIGLGNKMISKKVMVMH